MTDRSRRRLAVAALVLSLTAPATYMAQRLYERARHGPVDPSLILMSTHVDYLWRIAVATWWGGCCALLSWLWLRRRDDAGCDDWARRTAAAIVASAAVVTWLAWRLP